MSGVFVVIQNGHEHESSKKRLIKQAITLAPGERQQGTPRWFSLNCQRRKVTDPMHGPRQEMQIEPWLVTNLTHNPGLGHSSAPSTLAHFVPNTPTGATNAGDQRVEERFSWSIRARGGHDVPIQSVEVPCHAFHGTFPNVFPLSAI